MEALLSKEEFKEILEYVADLFHKEDMFCGALESLTNNGEPVAAFIYSQPIDFILKMLGKMMNDEDDDIGRFLYDLDAIGSANLSVDPEKCPAASDGETPLYHDADSLYDYLTREKE